MNRNRLLIAVPVVLLLAAVIGWMAFGRGGNEDAGMAASGTVEATDADLGFQVGGRVQAVAVVEGEQVGAGQLLAELDAADLRARHDAARAQLDAAQALLQELRAGARPEELRQAQAAEQAARERLGEAERMHARSAALEAGGAVSRESLDQAATALEVARAQHAQARNQLELVRRGPRAERVAGQAAAVRQAEAAVAQAAAALENATVRAPFAGVVTVRHRQPGEAVGPGAPVVTVMNPSDRWVRIYVREDAVGRVSLGQRAEIRSDSEPGRVYEGHVTHIAAQAEFTPRNVQTAEERVKLVYAVKVAVEGDAALALKPGMPADVSLLPR